MTKNSKTLADGGRTRASQCTRNYLERDNSKRPPITQPGTALCAFLKRYRNDLLTLPYNCHISRLVDCVDVLLNEVVDRGQHDRY